MNHTTNTRRAVDPDGSIGSVTKQQRKPHRRGNWNLLFAGFLIMATSACGVAVMTGTYVLPGTHEVHNMDHSENHPSFEAPGNNLREQRKHNQQHNQQFQEAYERHKRVAAMRRQRRDQRPVERRRALRSNRGS